MKNYYQTAKWMKASLVYMEGQHAELFPKPWQCPSRHLVHDTVSLKQSFLILGTSHPILREEVQRQTRLIALLIW